MGGAKAVRGGSADLRRVDRIERLQKALLNGNVAALLREREQGLGGV